MKKNNRAIHATRLVVTNAIASAMLLVYGRSAYAGTCIETPVASGNWVCSGAAGADITQPIIGAPVTVTTTPGFGINTAAGNALTINATGGISFIDTNASAISGAARAIYARNDATGDLSITTNGTLSSGASTIIVLNNGTGSTNITTTGSVNSSTRTAIYGRSGVATTGLTINSIDLTGALQGIGAINNGVGSTTITTTGTVTGTTNIGIYARNNGTATDLTIDSNVVNGGQLGILTRNYGVGATNITATGTVTGTARWGIYAGNHGNSTDVFISTADVFGGQDGIDARNFGTGETSITATGAVNAIGNIGIYARNIGTDLTITATDVYGGQRGISALNYGTGETIITTTGSVIGTNNFGIFASNSGTDLTISTADVRGGQNGIDARNFGSGETNVTATGVVTGAANNGIYARNTGTNLTITASDVSGGQRGIYAYNRGSGTTTVISTGTVTGTGTVGISTRHYGTDLTINSIDVTGGFGIIARNYGTGETNVTATGTVTGTNYDGIFVHNSGATTDLTINTADVTGLNRGIVANNNGTGATNIITSGAVVGSTGYGISVFTGGASTDLTITATDVTGGINGISFTNNGTGTTNLTTTGSVTGLGPYGIYARNNVSTNGLSLTTVDVAGAQTGIMASNNGGGATTVTSTGTVTGTGNIGVLVRNNYGTSSDITISTVDVTGGQFGIRAMNLGSGATTVTSTGTVIGTTGGGISVTHGGGNGDLTINAVDVVGGHTGIFGFNIGHNSSLNITTTGTVTATAPNNYFGIYARNGTYARDITVNAVDVTGGVAGIGTRNFGSGATTITTTGTATGTRRNGIYADTGANSTALTITANDAFGHQSGIFARNMGSGSTVITSTGTVTGDYQYGIYARNVGFGTSQDLSITAVDVEGNYIGILAQNASGGITTITSTGTVTGQNGITALSGFNDMTINAANITASNTGIATFSFGPGHTTISASGNIAGGTGSGINTNTDSNSLATINLASTSTVSASSGNAIINNLGNSIVNVAAGAIITGSVRLNDGSDTVNIAGGTNLAGITALDGGDDVLLGDGFIDILNLNSAWSGNLDGANILNWEFININGGTVGFSSTAINVGQINVNNFGSLNGSNNLSITGNAAVASGSRIIAGNANGTNVMNVSGNLFNAGSVQLSGPAAQQAAGDRLTVTGNYIGSGGTLVFDTVLNGDTSATDRLVVAGNTSGSTGIIVNNVGGLGAMTTGDGIMLVNVAGNSTANAFNLNNSVVAGAFNYRLYQNGIVNTADGDWYLRSSARGITSPAMAIPDMGNKVGLSMLGSLQERLGEQDNRGAWIRVVGNSGQQTFESSIGDFESRNDSYFIQAGTDLHQSENNRWGLFTAKTQSTTHMFDAGIDPAVEAGRAKVDGYAVGAYATHRTDTYYWDAVIQHSWLDATANSEADSFKTDSDNWLASFEFGSAFKFGNNNSLEPQVQIIAGKGSTDDVNDGFTSYNYSSEDVVVGRLGVLWSHAKEESNVKGSFVPFLKANVSRNFGDDSFVQIGVSDITTERNDTWAEIGLGFSVLTQHNWSIFMQYDYEKGLGQYDLENHSGTIGLRRNW